MACRSAGVPPSTATTTPAARRDSTVPRGTATCGGGNTTGCILSCRRFLLPLSAVVTSLSWVITLLTVAVATHAAAIHVTAFLRI